MKPKVTFLVADTKTKSKKAAHLFKTGYGRCNIMYSDNWLKLCRLGAYPRDLATYGILIGQYGDTGEFIKSAREKQKTFGILIMVTFLGLRQLLLLMDTLELPETIYGMILLTWIILGIGLILLI